MFTTKLKLIIGIVLVTIAVAVFALLKYQDGKIDDLNKAGGAATVVIAAQADVLEKKVESAKVDEVAVTNYVKKEEVVRNESIRRTERTEAKVAVIEKDYATKENTVENEAAKVAEVSRVRVTSLWDAYCAGSKEPREGCPVSPSADEEKQNAVSI